MQLIFRAVWNSPFRSIFKVLLPGVQVLRRGGRSQIVFCAKTPPICDWKGFGLVPILSKPPELSNQKVQQEAGGREPAVPPDPTPYPTSLQKRRNSQLTHGRRETGGSGIRSRSTISRIAATVSRTSCRNDGVNGISSARRVSRE